MMDRQEFENRLLSLGGDLDRWPEAERREALALLGADAEARRMLEEIRRTDEAVLAAAVISPAGQLAARILSAASGDADRAAFSITPAGIAGALAGSAGLAGLGYVAAAGIASVVAPAALFDLVSAVSAGAISGAF